MHNMENFGMMPSNQQPMMNQSQGWNNNPWNNLEMRIRQIERELNRIDNRIKRLEQNLGMQYGNNYQRDSYNMM